MTNMKRIISAFTAAALCATACPFAMATASALSADEVDSILVLGDSISTGYGLDTQLDSSYADHLGTFFGAEVTNYAVNGQTSWELLDTLKGYTDGSEQKTAVVDADVICVSIGGNDLLRPARDFLQTTLKAYNTHNGTDYSAGEYLKAIADDSAATTALSKGLASAMSAALKNTVGFADVTDASGNVTEAGYIGYISELEQTLRSMNSDAQIVFQTIYNPVALSSVENDGTDYSAQYAEIRAFADTQLTRVNTAIKQKAADNDILIADIATAFKNPDRALSTEWVYTNAADGDVHPNALGHAVIAAETLKQLGATGQNCNKFNAVLAASSEKLTTTGQYNAVSELLAAYAPAVASTGLTVNSATGTSGTTIDIPVQLTSAASVAGIDVDMILPDGFICNSITTTLNGTVVKNIDAPSFVFTDASGANRDLAAGTTLFTMNVTLPTVTEATTYKIDFEAADLVDSDGVSLTLNLTAGSVMVAPAATYDGCTYVIDNVLGKPGETVTVPVYIYNDPGTAGLTARFEFPEELTYTRRKAGTAYAGTPTWNPATGDYVWNAGDGRNLTAADGATLTYFLFTIPDDAVNGVYKIAFNHDEVIADVGDPRQATQSVDENGVDLAITYIDGSITVVGGIEPSFVKGDVNEDGKVDSSDAVLVLKQTAAAMIGGSLNLSDNQLLAADVDENGTINSSDACYILQYYAKNMVGSVDWSELIK